MALLPRDHHRDSSEEDDSGSRADDEEAMSVLFTVLGTILALALLLAVLWCVCRKCFGCEINWRTPSSSVQDGYELDSDDVIICDSQPTGRGKASDPYELAAFGLNGAFTPSPGDSVYTISPLGVSEERQTWSTRIQPRTLTDLPDRYIYDGKLRAPGGRSRSLPIRNDSSVSGFRQDQELRELCRVGMTQSETIMVDSKLVVFIAREVSHLGDTLVLNEMGISLTIPPYAIDAGRTELISLILDWDLGDFPEMTDEESIISPVVHCGPHGLKLNKPAVLSYKHCAYDTKTVSLVASETHLMQAKDWKQVCGRDDRVKPYTLLANEVQVQLTHFTLFTCLSEGKLSTKKWMQLAVFGGKMRPRHRYEIRLYFLNNTPCALQFAIQNEAKNHFKMLCPRKEFLFHGDGEDILATIQHINEGWSQRVDDRQERVPFQSLWHGKCPSVSFIFKHENERVREFDVRLEVSQRGRENIASDKTNLKVLASMRSGVSRHRVDNRSGSNKAVINVFPSRSGGKRRRRGSESSVSYSSDSIRSSSSQASNASSSSLTSSSSSSNPSSGTNTDSDSHSEHTGNSTQQPCTQNMQIHIYPSPSSLPKSLTKRTIPHELCMELVVLLDPLCPFGNDWRVLASALEMSSLIPLLKNTPSYNPTETLLEEVERQSKTLEWLASVMVKAKRLDAANVVMKYVNNTKNTSCIENKT